MEKSAVTMEAQPSMPSSTSSEKGEILKQALNHLVQGKRHLLVKDITSAIISLGEACRLLSEANGPLCADNAEAHFYYGKALLEQARLELAVFDGGAPAAEKEETEGDDGSEDEEKEGDEDGSEDEEKEEESETMSNGDEDGTEKEEQEKTSTADANPADNENEVKVEKKEEDLSTPSPTSNEASDTNNVQDDEKPSTSTGATNENGNAETEDELSNLELAWEVLEISKICYNSQLKLVRDQLATATVEEEKTNMMKSKLHLQKRLAENHSLLGEVATESENYSIAVEEFNTGIEIISEIEAEDSRDVAQYYFQMGLAQAFAKQFQDAISSFKKSKTIIELRISNLQSKIDNKQTCKDLGIELENAVTEDVEISELQAILPELDEKVADTLDAERENKATLEEEVKDKEIALKNSPVKNPNPPAANDISHLVKKKKKAEDSPEVPPPKRICSDANNGSGEAGETNGRGHENGATMVKSLNLPLI